MRSFTPKVKGRHHKCPVAFDGLIDIQHVPDSSLIKQAQTSVGTALTHAGNGENPVADIH